MIQSWNILHEIIISTISEILLTDFILNMSRFLESRAKEITANVMEYFKSEKENDRLILLRLLTLEKLCSDNEISVPKDFLFQLISYFKKSSNILKRTAAATNVGVTTLKKIKIEKAEAVASSSKLKSPSKKRQCIPKIILGGFDLNALRNIIHSFYTVHKEVPTLKNVLALAKQDLNFAGERTTLRKILCSTLGYKFKKCDQQHRKQLIEKSDIRIWRAKYLKRIRENDVLGVNKKKVIYVDETWIHSNNSVEICFQPSSDVGVIKKRSYGHKWIIVHAGSETGFIDGAQLVFKATKTCNNHIQMNTENFVKWIKEKLIPNIPPNCIIVMDDAPYHRKERCKPPTINSKMEDILEWLQNNNLDIPQKATKPELYEIVKRNKPPKNCIIDQIFEENGHEVCRLSPYNRDLNPIELIWNLFKQRVTDNNAEQFESITEGSILQSLSSITADDWQTEVTHVKRLEEEYWSRDRHVDDTFIINTENDSSSESSGDSSGEEETNGEESE